MSDEIDRLLHDADRKVGGIYMAQMMGDFRAAAEMRAEAKGLYAEALRRDPNHTDPAWREFGNQDDDWLRVNGLGEVVTARKGPRGQARETGKEVDE